MKELLWHPDVPEARRSGNGIENVRYRARWKTVWVQRLLDLIAGVATRRTAPWSPTEDEELAACVSADDLEVFALRWSRTFRAVEQRQ